MSHYLAGCPYPYDQCKCERPAADQPREQRNATENERTKRGNK